MYAVMTALVCKIVKPNKKDYLLIESFTVIILVNDPKIIQGLFTKHIFERPFFLNKRSCSLGAFNNVLLFCGYGTDYDELIIGVI